MNPSGHLLQLNEAQRQAACFGGRRGGEKFTAPALLVIAGAGTGKTNTLAHRVAQLVIEGIDPARILLLTFTRRAALEMTRRAERIVGEALRRGGPAAVRIPWSGTFHSVANRVLREYSQALGIAPDFSVLDRGDAADLIDLLRHERGLSAQKRRFPRKDTCLAIYSHRVNGARALEEVLHDGFPWCEEWAEELRGLFREFVERKQANAALDYDDLLLYWHALMQEPVLAAEVGGRFDHVLVDEYQDVNRLQADIVLALKPGGTGLTVVGDDAQAIYSFRAASVGNILEFPDRCLPRAEVIALERNYRSSQPLLDAANALIAGAGRQFRKTLVAARNGGARPRLVTVQDDRQQAGYVVQGVLQHREAGTLLRRQAVLFRSSDHSDWLEIELMRANIPYVKYGGLRFLEAAHVKDLLAVLRWADNPRNGLAAFRVLQLPAGMGPANASRIWQRVAGAGFRVSELTACDPPAAAAETWPAFSGMMSQLSDPHTAWPGQIAIVRAWYEPQLPRLYESAGVRAADLDMLQQLSSQYGSRQRFLTELTLDPPSASGELAGPPLLDEDYLVLSTVHSAKGQEWDAVYVLNVTDGNFPSEFAAGNADAIDEERRLLYVAMTRARDELHLIEPLRYYVTQQPRTGDRHVYGARSRFLDAAVLDTLDRATWPGNSERGLAHAATPSAVRVDVAGCLKALW
ncbi:MAG: ATP-dependent helicase [Gammaproteobacteria bacterium]|nr:ATP-dependent helicase [Gammaproteobacteria bacterium]